ncbi:MAG: acyl-CoA synthetase FdrA, partial [Deltaproteobacteria bacterium]|nr:acyl-CoA synthetase FdrA [Deltaproteobacteria bacterium]
VKKNSYQDSMKLMNISQKLSSLSGIKKAAAIMATEANLAMLKETGLIQKVTDSASPNDLIVAIEAESDKAANEALKMLDSLLAPHQARVTSEIEYKDLDSARNALPQANIVIVSVPGEYAKLEVAKAINRGLHVFLFSDNMSIDEEIELKLRAKEKGLLMMGPGCGTAIINGLGLGFSNVVNRGPIGVIAAAGTGMQEVTSLINNWGSGISHAIGVGGRDLSDRVGGIMTTEAIRMLQVDEGTKALLLVSKPPSDKVGRKVIDLILKGDLPAVICFLGMENIKAKDSKIRFAKNLEQAALTAIKLVGATETTPKVLSDSKWKKAAQECKSSLNTKQRYLRGLFSGGTFCYEAQQILTPILGKIYSNAPLNEKKRLKNPKASKQHTCIDLGEEEFTKGHAHPMIDSTQRRERLIQEAADPNVAVILFDVVLGYVASPDPAGDLIPVINESKKIAKNNGRSITFVAHVCGTEQDPQDLKSQEKKLEKAGVLVLPTNALACRVAGFIATRGKITTSI